VKALLKRYAERIDAATLRERVLIFLSLTLGLVFAANLALLEPLRAQQKRLAAQTAQEQKELQTIQSQLQRLAVSVQNDPDGPSRARQGELREQMAKLDARVTQEQRRFTPPERMRAVLEEILQRNSGLTLVDLRSLPVAPVGEPAPAGGPRPAGAGSGALYRHGIELTVSGSYLELYEYLRQLERLPTQLYWRQAELAVGKYPVVTLKLTAYTVSFDPAWLIV
jgi:MSHA biogenesis protein MshJ